MIHTPFLHGGLGLAKTVASAPAGSWYSAVDEALGNVSDGWSGYTLRQRISASRLVAGTKLRITLAGGPAEGFVLSAAYVQTKAGAGDDYDFSAAPAQFLFSTSAGVTIGSGDQTILSDDLTFSQDGSSDLVISLYFSGASTIRYATPGGAGVACYYKAGSDGTTVNATGYTSTAGTLSALSKLEIWVP